MKSTHWLSSLALLVLVFLAGCSRNDGEDAKIKANLAQLSPEDAKLAEEQKFCAVETEHRLGSMGKPVKVMVKDQPVFLCCNGCKKKAEEDPDKTLATVKDLKAKAAADNK